MKKVFIDGSAGTTGLRIRERLGLRKDIEIIGVPEEKRKDVLTRKAAINAADIVFLCLPDDAAAESVSLKENETTVIIDTSTAHRTKEGWVYGFPEIDGRKEKIKKAKLIANPGCHASGFIALVAPLTQNKILSKGSRLSCFSLTGYSGGGKKMIEAYEKNPVATTGVLQNPDQLLMSAPRMYGLGQNHKHIPEMMKICGLDNAPVFCPVVAPFYSGMEVVVSLDLSEIKAGANEIKAVYADYYKKGLVHFDAECDEGGFLSAAGLSGRDDMQISVYGNKERIVLVSRFDNLGKGACGAAIQNMNIALGIDEKEGLIFDGGY